jgi:hypothetical protein
MTSFRAIIYRDEPYEAAVFSSELPATYRDPKDAYAALRAAGDRLCAHSGWWQWTGTIHAGEYVPEEAEPGVWLKRWQDTIPAQQWYCGPTWMERDC